MVTEELARGCATTSFLHSYSYGLVGHPILTFGNEEQKKQYMPGLAQGKIVGAFALTEPGAGTDVSSATTTAVKNGDEYIINGTKTFITNAIIADVFGGIRLYRPFCRLQGHDRLFNPQRNPGNHSEQNI